MITTMTTCIAEKLGRRAKEEPTALNQALSAGTDREKNMSEANFSPETNLMTIKNQIGAQVLLLFAILCLLAWAIFLKPSPKPADRFQKTESPYRAGFEGSGTFAVPDGWDEKQVQSYLDIYRADDPQGFL